MEEVKHPGGDEEKLQRMDRRGPLWEAANGDLFTATGRSYR